MHTAFGTAPFRHLLTILGWIALFGSASALGQHPTLPDEPSTPALCLTCHDSVKKAVALNPHGALDAGCLTCHDLAKGTQPPYLAARGNDVCLSCHVATGRAGAPRARGNEPRSFSSAARPINLNARGVGHPVRNHPVSGPRNPLDVKRAFDCLSCHTPHGSASPRLLSFSVTPGEGICQKCHEL